jgi:hypothetical protein
MKKPPRSTNLFVRAVSMAVFLSTIAAMGAVGSYLVRPGEDAVWKEWSPRRPWSLFYVFNRYRVSVLLAVPSNEVVPAAAYGAIREGRSNEVLGAVIYGVPQFTQYGDTMDADIKTDVLVLGDDSAMNPTFLYESRLRWYREDEADLAGLSPPVGHVEHRVHIERKAFCSVFLLSAGFLLLLPFMRRSASELLHVGFRFTSSLLRQVGFVHERPPPPRGFPVQLVKEDSRRKAETEPTERSRL